MIFRTPTQILVVTYRPTCYLFVARRQSSFLHATHTIYAGSPASCLLWEPGEFPVICCSQCLTSFWHATHAIYAACFNMPWGSSSQYPTIVFMVIFPKHLYTPNFLLIWNTLCHLIRNLINLWDYKHLRRRLKCNSYRRGKWTRWPEFKNWTKLLAFSHNANTLGKSMNPTILPPPSYGQIVVTTELFNLGIATSLEGGKPWIQGC